MEAWEKWWRMAQDSYASAQLLQQHGQFRASASRSYYAAYQSVTAVLLYQKQISPDGREAWSHEATPDLLRKMSGRLLSADACKDVALRLEASYELRIVADYISAANVEEAKLKVSRKDVGFIIKLIRSVLPQDRV
jgi:uncharacterized protein (UPF0332 family)